MSDSVVTYLDFGTKHLHLARSFQGIEADVAKCGLGLALRTDAARPARFKDRPGLFPGEMCKRCLASTQQSGERGHLNG